MLRLICLLTVLALTSAVDNSFSLRGAADAMVMEEEQLEDHRSLTILEALPCPVTGLPTSYFNLTFGFEPRADAKPKVCNSEVKQQIGDKINDFLLKFGVGKEGSGDDIMFLSEVCPIPQEISAGTRRELSADESRVLTTIGDFRFVGGGACKFCSVDNFDARRQLWTLDPSKSWFNSNFKPFMEIALKLKFYFEIVPEVPECFDWTSMLNVTVTEVKMNPKTAC